MLNDVNFEMKESPENAGMPMDITFSSFILSLASSALICMGEIEDPTSKKREKNKILAKQNIDILSILYDKTKGNLSDDEDKMLNSILYDLRLKYVNHSF